MTVATEEAAVENDGAAVREAKERSNLYGFLAAVFRCEPTAGLLRQIKAPDFAGALSAAGVSWDEGFLDRPEAELVEALAVEYTGLFIGPGKHVPPYASVYLPGEHGELWGPSTARVKRFIEAAGFEYHDQYRDLPDHLSAELEFMKHLAAREAQALEEADGEVAARCRKVGTEFLTAHLAVWIPEFCRRIARDATLPFYREMAGLLADFIQSEAERAPAPDS